MRQLLQTSRCARRQKGGITLFSGVLILILLTQMIVYAVQSGVFEQRKSANELRQKRAFHIAESGIEAAKSFIASNAFLVTLDEDDALPDGTDGWFSATGTRWLDCPDASALAADVTHPCNAEEDSNLLDGTYFYSFGGDMKLPVDGAIYSEEWDDDQVEVYALLCMFEINRDDPDNPPVEGCTQDADEQDFRYWMVTLAARGKADCSNGICNATALVTQRFGSYGPSTGGDGPAAPLTSISTVPPNGAAEIVVNPNGNGPGVPVGAWMNGRDGSDPDCPAEDPLDGNGGSWATCEYNEWYETMQMPEDLKCPVANCSCGSDERLLSYGDSGGSHIGIDMIEDPNFPCDLFQYSFGVPKVDYQEIKNQATVIDDCESLGPGSSGLYWVTGTCQLNAGVQVGTQFTPIYLVAAGSTTRCNGGATLFGTLFVTDAENSDASFHGQGNCTIYGAGIVDADLSQYNGTFQIVYQGDVIERSSDGGQIGAVPGGWNDFPQVWR